jgi:hypothetical protein
MGSMLDGDVRNRPEADIQQYEGDVRFMLTADISLRWVDGSLRPRAGITNLPLFEDSANRFK